MQYLAAYTLASLSGKEPSNWLINSAADTVTNILKATGQKFDEAEVTKVVNSLKGKKLEDVYNWIIKLIKAGTSKVGSVGGSSSAPKQSAPQPAKK